MDGLYPAGSRKLCTRALCQRVGEGVDMHELTTEEAEGRVFCSRVKGRFSISTSPAVVRIGVSNKKELYTTQTTALGFLFPHNLV
jgi:hypothetical protein